MKKYHTPKEIQKRRMNKWKIMSLCIFFLLLLILIICLVRPDFLRLNIDDDPIQRIFLEHIAGPVTVFFGSVAGFFITKYHTLKSEASRERASYTLYYSEFEDMIRHLNANMRILAKLILELDGSNSNTRISSVHMTNLKLPDTSCLFSDSMAMIIEDGKIDGFARLKVNLRNINNSAEYLASYSKDDSYTRKNMIELLKWELTRHFGYYVNFRYMKEHSFKFADNDQLDEYIVCDSNVKSELRDIFMDEDNTAKKDILVHEYLNRYKKDRREERSVIIFK